MQVNGKYVRSAIWRAETSDEPEQHSEWSYEPGLVGRDNESDQVESKKSSYDVSVPSAPAPQLEGGSSPPKPVVNQPKLNLDALNKQREDAESERLSPHAQPSDRPSTKASSQAELVLPVFASFEANSSIVAPSNARREPGGSCQ